MVCVCSHYNVDAMCSGTLKTIPAILIENDLFYRNAQLLVVAFRTDIYIHTFVCSFYECYEILCRLRQYKNLLAE